MSDQISPQQFYGASQFVAPALHPGKGQKAALQSARRLESRSFRIFATQQQAFTQCDQSPGQKLRVWAFEIDGKGRRRFVVASYSSFWRWYRRFIRRGSTLHFYEIIRERHACKLYFDLEYPLQSNADAHPEAMVDAVCAVCAELSGIKGVLRHSENVVELDSTTEKKFSRHLVFETIAFHDNIQAGDFARRVVETLATRDEKLVLVRKADGEIVPFVDLAVYTKNRCFRLVGSSKFGKETQLRPLNTPSSGRLALSEELFLRSLVCRVNDNVQLLGFVSALPTAQRGVAATYRRDDSRRESGDSQWQQSSQSSTFPLLDEYVLSLTRPHNGGIYGVTYFSASETVMYAIKGGYKYCANIGRHHKSNNVILIADLCARSMYQKCFDPDCRTFRSQPWTLPAMLFPEAEEGRDSYIDEDISDSCLTEMMDCVEGQFTRDASGVVPDSDGGELSDDVLNAMMDELEGGSDAVRMSVGGEETEGNFDR